MESYGLNFYQFTTAKIYSGLNKNGNVLSMFLLSNMLLIRPSIGR